MILQSIQTRLHTSLIKGLLITSFLGFAGPASAGMAQSKSAGLNLAAPCCHYYVVEGTCARRPNGADTRGNIIYNYFCNTTAGAPPQWRCEQSLACNLPSLGDCANMKVDWTGARHNPATNDQVSTTTCVASVGGSAATGSGSCGKDPVQQGDSCR
jgi:hypothetical protein